MDKKCDNCDYSLPYGKDYVNCEKIGRIVGRTFSCKFFNNEDSNTSSSESLCD